MNPGNFLEQFLGGGVMQDMRQAGGSARRQLDGVGVPGFTGGALAGGVLGLMLGSKKMRKMTVGLMGYGAPGGAGALAYQAYRNWQQGQAVATAPLPLAADVSNVDQNFLPGNAPAADGKPFQLAFVTAMIAAAKADGHIDAVEQKSLFEKIESMGLDAESKAFVFDALARPVDINAIAASANGIEQASELYLVSRFAIDPDHPAERSYLEALSFKLKLPPELVAHLNHQVEAGSASES
ncbi:MAG: tellurite resistance TerB family protein [Xanthomonadales bacterium]|nr:tellurite resistance TerB family protein [Xanthomonadales bacterium]